MPSVQSMCSPGQSECGDSGRRGRSQQDPGHMSHGPTASLGPMASLPHRLCPACSDAGSGRRGEVRDGRMDGGREGGR